LERSQRLNTDPRPERTMRWWRQLSHRPKRVGGMGATVSSRPMAASDTETLCPHCGKVSATSPRWGLCTDCGRAKDGRGPISARFRPRYDPDDDADGGIGLVWALVPGLAIALLLLIFAGAELFVLALVLLLVAMVALDVFDLI
jgi:hypothetical protein